MDELNLHEGKKGDSIERQYLLASTNNSSLKINLVQPGPAPASYSVNISVSSISTSNVSIEFQLDTSRDETGVTDAVYSPEIDYSENINTPYVDYYFNMAPGMSVYQEIDENFNCYDCSTSVYYEIMLVSNGTSEINFNYMILKASKMEHAFVNFYLNSFLLSFIIIYRVKKYQK